MKMYYVIDEASEEVLENNSDLQDAINTAKELAKQAHPYGCYLVVDNNDKVYYRTSEFSYKFTSENKAKTNKNMKQNTIKLNESQLKKVIGESVKRVMNEMFGLHKHKHFPLIRYEEEYSKEGEPYFHHTYRITYCSDCGKVLKREQLQ